MTIGLRLSAAGSAKRSHGLGSLSPGVPRAAPASMGTVRPRAGSAGLRQTPGMDHRDHVRLIREGVEGAGPSWADLGSGEGAFTLALADVLGQGGSIISVDRDAGALAVLARTMRGRFPDVALTTLQADFSQSLDLPPLDGIVMANSLHFSRDKLPVLRLVRAHLRPGGRLILVEYDADRGNPWVPHPLSFRAWRASNWVAATCSTV